MEDNLVYSEIIKPIVPMIQIHQESEKLHGDKENYTLSFCPFTLNLLYYVIKGIKSISQLVTHIKTSSEAQELELVCASKSMYSESFIRYDASIFRAIFFQLLLGLDFMGVPDLKALGQLCCVDGSFFPAFITMQWATYKEKVMGIKLHLCFELNRMLATEFVVGPGNSSEKNALLKMAKEGVTYIADRGYVKFALFKDIVDRGAHFVIRIKSNLIYKIVETFDINIPDNIIPFFQEVKDLKITFGSDQARKQYRLVSFTTMGITFHLVTDRFDLTTYQVIILYAYRWQVELIFKFFKRTLNGLHLINHSQNGVEIQFTLFLMASVLLLHFNQRCHKISSSKEIETILTDSSQPKDHSQTLAKPLACGLVTILGEGLRKIWKIGIHWLIILRNKFLFTFNAEIATELAKT
jgi:hypothetical protein